MMKVLRMVPVLLMLSLLVAACGSKPASKPETQTNPTKTTPGTTAAAPVKDLGKSTIAIGGGRTTIVYLPAVFAASNNYFKDAGVDMEMIDLKSGAEAAQAVVSGQVDFGALAMEHAVKAKAQGADLVMLDLFARYPGLTLIVDSKLKDKVKSINDLKGMKVGVSSPGSGTHKALLSLMDKFGMKPTDIEVLGVGTSGMPAAIEAGKVQAAVGVDPWVTQMVTSGKAYIMWDLRTKKDTEALYGSEYPHVGLVTRRDVIEKKPELVAAVVRAVVRGNKFLASNSPETITSKLPVDVKGADEVLYLASLRLNLDSLSPDGLATQKSLQTVIDSLKKDKVVPESVTITPDMVFDGSFAQKSQ